MANLFVILLFKDLMYLNDFEESVGTIIKSATKTTDIDKKKACYLKTLAMNQLVDIYAFENMIQKARSRVPSRALAKEQRAEKITPWS
ncbi:hypothetical protein PS15p_209560 [Mucor circinelloides]